MKKRSLILHTRKWGFSLAEALVTLLIVCLITLASIPVLTKKKRTVAHGASGKYMCTVLPAYVYKKKNIFSKGEASIEYKYVYYNSQAPVGDINNPSTWAVADGDHCKFVPPLNAKNFGVTLIGGGGAGGNGVSKLTPVLNYNIPTYRSTEESVYNITMVGGGAGGGGGSNQSGVAGSGGGGGGFIMGEVVLPAGNLYSFEIGDGSPDYGAFSASQSAEPRAKNGGDTKFKVETPSGTKVLMKAGGGTGGQTRTCKNRLGSWKCGGGNYSPGGTYNIDYGVEARRYYSIISTSGGQGFGGANTITTSDGYSTAGSGISVNGVYYGAGGRGRRHCRDIDCAEDGQRGTFSLDRQDIFGGEGGSAAVPVVIPMPKIEGYLKIRVGAGGAQFYDLSQDGEPTIVEVYNSASKFLRQYAAKGGEAGGQTREQTPTAGENSLWDNSAGGTTGTCKKGKAAYYTYESKEVEVDDTTKCKFALGTSTDADRAITFLEERNNIEEEMYKKTAFQNYTKCGSVIISSNYYTSYTSPSFPLRLRLRRLGFSPYRCEKFYGCDTYGYQARTDLNLSVPPKKTVCVDGSVDLSSYDIDPEDPDYVEKLIKELTKLGLRYWAYDAPFEYECIEYEKKKIIVQEPVYHPEVPATCDRAGSGKQYGSGGGGGAASETIGVAGLGGYGAPGLVVIEW